MEAGIGEYRVYCITLKVVAKSFNDGDTEWDPYGVNWTEAIHVGSESEEEQISARIAGVRVKEDVDQTAQDKCQLFYGDRNE